MTSEELNVLLHKMYPNHRTEPLPYASIVYDYRGINLKFSISGERVTVTHYTTYCIDSNYVDIYVFLPTQGSAKTFKTSFDPTKDFRDINARLDIKISKHYLVYSVKNAILDYHKSLIADEQFDTLKSELQSVCGANFHQGKIRTTYGIDKVHIELSINTDKTISLHLDKIDLAQFKSIVEHFN